MKDKMKIEVVSGILPHPRKYLVSAIIFSIHMPFTTNIGFMCVPPMN
jgi:hypothetical protein